MRKVLMGIFALFLCSNCFAESVPEVFIQTVAMESANQSSFGQFLVARVIVNRARRSGKTYKEVCLKKWQFSAWNDGEWSRAWLDKHYTKEVRERALNAINRAIVASSYDSIRHYHTIDVHPKWSIGERPLIKEGKHVFYEGIR